MNIFIFLRVPRITRVEKEIAKKITPYFFLDNLMGRKPNNIYILKAFFLLSYISRAILTSLKSWERISQITSWSFCNPKTLKIKPKKTFYNRRRSHVSRIHAKARQGCGTEGAQNSRRHVRNMGRRCSSHPLHSSLSQPRKRRTQARPLDSHTMVILLSNLNFTLLYANVWILFWNFCFQDPLRWIVIWKIWVN